MNITFDMLVTASAVPIAGSIITVLVELVKKAFPVVDARVSGASLAFGFSAALYVCTAWAIAQSGSFTPNDALNVFLSWLAVASASVGIKSTWVHATNS